MSDPIADLKGGLTEFLFMPYFTPVSWFAPIGRNGIGGPMYTQLEAEVRPLETVAASDADMRLGLLLQVESALKWITTEGWCFEDVPNIEFHGSLSRRYGPSPIIIHQCTLKVKIIRDR